MHYWKLDEQEGVVFRHSTASANNGAPTVYWSTQVSEPDDEPEYTNDGFNFTEGKKWETVKPVNAQLASVEAWASYTEAQQTAVKSLCDQYLDTVSGWKLTSIYPVTEDTETETEETTSVA